MADRALYYHGHQGFMLSWLTDFILLRPSRLHTIPADRSCHGYQGHILSWPLKASNFHGFQGFILSSLSGLYTVTAVRASYCHGFLLLRLSWLHNVMLTGLYTVTADRALYCHGWKGFVLSRPTVLYTVMAVSASYCHGRQGFTLSWL